MAAVYDGDTVRLQDGRTVRFIGINTPELGHDDGPDQPLAARARDALQELLDASDRIGLQIGPDRHDHYGRLLAHVYTDDGRSVTRTLLARGLGWQVVFPPNLAHHTCYARAEAAAHSARRGVWDQPAYRAIDAGALARDAGGFRRVRGRIARVGTSKRAYWLELDGLTLRLARADLAYFKPADPREWRGRTLQVRGWIYRVDGRARMNLRHPAAIEWEEREP